jgi:hypothetical protein
MVRGSSPATDKVVDLARFRARRARERVGLPLFDEAVEAGASSRSATVPARELSAREVEHRRRMLRFMGASASG